MSDFNRNTGAAWRGVGTDRAAAIDQGLRAYMIRVYNYMTIGVALTGVLAWLTYQMAGGDAISVVGGRVSGLTPFGVAIFNPITTIVLFLGTLGLVFLISWRVDRLQPTTALGLFLLYAGLLGVMLSSIFLTYTGVSITRVFFISAASFGALSLWGYSTARDLTAMGTFLRMGLIGLVFAVLAEVILGFFGIHSGMFSFIISIVGVLIFAGLTAYDTQKIKEMYDVQDDGTIVGRKAVMGALTLYLDFINLFLFMLRLLGDRR
jgi:FtsH-binding integral membrane protein